MLEAEGLDVLGRRADEGDALGLEPAGKGGVFAEEAVAGMDGLGAGGFAGGDDGIDIEVGLGGRSRAEADGLVGELHGLGEAVGIGIDGDRGDAHALERADDPHRDLAAVGDEDFGEHHSASHTST